MTPDSLESKAGLFQFQNHCAWSRNCDASKASCARLVTNVLFRPSLKTQSADKTPVSIRFPHQPKIPGSGLSVRSPVQ